MHLFVAFKSGSNKIHSKIHQFSLHLTLIKKKVGPKSDIIADITEFLKTRRSILLFWREN